MAKRTRQQVKMASIFADLSIRNKFLAVTFVSLFLLGLGGAVLIKPVLESSLYKVIIKRGVTLAKSMAFHSEHDFLAEDYLVLNLTLTDYKKTASELSYVFIVNDQGRVIAHTFDDGFPLELGQVNKLDKTSEHGIERLLTDEGEVFDIAVPLTSNRMGFLHVGISGNEIEAETDNLLRVIIILVSLAFLGGAIIATLASRFITRPLQELAKAAEMVAIGDLDYRLEVSSGDEVGRVKRVFNEMVARRQEREQEKEELIRELNEALDEVKVLSGMLPICAACKKIRDDKGYWNNLESYIRERSEAEFTHGICPDCARELYPDFIDKK